MSPRLDRLKQATEPTAADLERLRTRVLPPSPGPLLRRLPTPAGSLVRRPPRGRRWWLGALAVVGLAGGALLPRPAVHAELGVTPLAGFTVDGVGHARIDGRSLITRGAATVDWQVGTLHAYVDARDPVLTVTTREGRVVAEAGELVVTRDALGTQILGGTPVCFGTRSGDRCLPVSAVGWLARAQALADGGAPVDTIVAATQAGLAAPDADKDVSGELVAAQVDAWLHAGRTDEAAAAARAYPAGGPREKDLAPLIQTTRGNLW